MTGAHNMKFGYQGAYMYDIDTLFNIINNKYRVSYRFNNTVPNQITQQAGEFERVVNTEYAAFYAQEQWTRGRLTLQGALRFDHAWSHFPEQTIGPDLFIPTPIVVPAEQGVRGLQQPLAPGRRGLRPARRRQDVGEDLSRQVPLAGHQPEPLRAHESRWSASRRS